MHNCIHLLKFERYREIIPLKFFVRVVQHLVLAFTIGSLSSCTNFSGLARLNYFCRVHNKRRNRATYCQWIFWSLLFFHRTIWCQFSHLNISTSRYVHYNKYAICVKFDCFEISNELYLHMLYLYSVCFRLKVKTELKNLVCDYVVWLIKWLYYLQKITSTQNC